MKRTIAAAVLCLGLMSASAHAADNWLLVTFRVLAVCTESLEYYLSSDGIEWNAPGPILTTYNVNGATDGTRDPSIAKVASSTWDLLNTDCTGGNNFFDLSTSTTLYSWSNAAHISLASVAGLNHTWAPEWVKNLDGTLYLDGSGIPHITVTATTAMIASSGPFILYEVHPNSSDYTTWITPANWSNPAAITVTGVTTLIDTYMICVNGTASLCTGSGDTFYLFYDPFPGTEEIQYASSSTLTGTFTNIKTGNWIGSGTTLQEGPNMIHLSDRWRIYYDYNPTSSTVGNLAYQDSLDFNITTGAGSWSAAIFLGTGAQSKHGTVIPYP